MFLKIKLIFTLVLSIVLLGCTSQTFAPEEEANKMAEMFIQSVNSGNYDAAFALVTDDFFSYRAKEQWQEYYKEIAEHMGPVISVKQTRKHVDSRLTGQFYMYQFSIKHENGFTKEMVTFIQKINTEEPLKVLAHKIDSSKLAKINAKYE